MRDVQGLQQWQLEELAGDGGQLVVREIYVGEVICVHGSWLQEGGQEHRQGDVPPEEVEGSGHLNGGSGVMDGQGVLVPFVQEDAGVLPGQQLRQILQLQVLEPGHLPKRVVPCNRACSVHSSI